MRFSYRPSWPRYHSAGEPGRDVYRSFCPLNTSRNVRTSPTSSVYRARCCSCWRGGRELQVGRVLAGHRPVRCVTQPESRERQLSLPPPTRPLQLSTLQQPHHVPCMYHQCRAANMTYHVSTSLLHSPSWNGWETTLIISFSLKMDNDNKTLTIWTI